MLLKQISRIVSIFQNATSNENDGCNNSIVAVDWFFKFARALTWKTERAKTRRLQKNAE